jgi:phytoene/squalene synthetase
VSVDHYENFPVASVLCPPRLRPPIVAIYHFARTADDLADEGEATPLARLADLAEYRRALLAATQAGALAPRWQSVFAPLRRQVQAFALPVDLLHDLLDAFEQDVRNPHYPIAGRCWTIAAARPTRLAACCCTCTASRMRKRCSDPTPSAVPCN